MLDPFRALLRCPWAPGTPVQSTCRGQLPHADIFLSHWQHLFFICSNLCGLCQKFWFWLADVSDHGLPGLRDVKYRHFLDVSKPVRHAAAQSNHRVKRSPVFGTGVRVCPQDTMKEIVGSHRTYYKLRGKFNSESSECVSVPVNLRKNICVNMLTV